MTYAVIVLKACANAFHGMKKGDVGKGKTMRLIDADALIDALGISDEDIVFEAILEDEPTIDAVPVVRCKDCVFGMADDSYSPSLYLCQHRWDDWNNWNRGNHYCSYGERKDNE